MTGGGDGDAPEVSGDTADDTSGDTAGSLAGLMDELYSMAPGAFTPARNDVAARLRREGERELSDRVKALRKPTAAAWVVNMLVRHESAEMTQVLDLGAALRQAQADLDGEALRELNRQRRRLVAAVAGKGRALARELGEKISEAVQRQVEETLHAAMIDTDAEAAVRTGLLLDPLSATGVGSLKVATAVADHTALGGPGPGVATGSPGSLGIRTSSLSVVPEADPEERRREQRRQERRRAREAATAAEARAQETLTSARADLESREGTVSELQAAALQVNGEIDELRRRIDGLEDRLEEIDEQAERVQAEREESVAAVALAESAVTEAQSRLDGLPPE